MGKFTDWLMKNNDDDNNGEDFRYNSVPENNFDRFMSEKMQFDKPVRPEPVESRDKRGIFGLRGKSAEQPVENGSNVVIYSPKTYEDVQTLIDYLKRGEPVVVDLSGISSDSAQRILDFMSGAVYGLSGNIHKITGKIFMLTPKGMSIKVPSQGGER